MDHLVITAPGRVPVPSEDWAYKPHVFLAGGIGNCDDWQQRLIMLLEQYSACEIVILNPRREIPIKMNGPEAREQTTWEFQALKRCEIFSMWFTNETVQPICLYELGRHATLLHDTPQNILVGIQPGYEREFDVRTQLELINPKISRRISDNLDDHAKRIADAASLL